MNNQEMIKFLEDNFPILKHQVGLDDNGNVSFSIELEDPDVVEGLCDKLYSLEPYFNNQGYELLMQDDSEYFGAMLSKV